MGKIIVLIKAYKSYLTYVGSLMLNRAMTHKHRYLLDDNARCPYILRYQILKHKLSSPTYAILKSNKFK
jgi:hypothetical protein